jgi:hypothetical protein
MKRDIQLIRKILIEIEKTSDGVRIAQVKIENYPREQIQYHLALLDEAGLIIAKDASSGGSLSIMPIRLTWEGYEFLDNARNDTVWNKTLHDIGEITESVALPLLRELLTAALRSQILPHLGL